MRMKMRHCSLGLAIFLAIASPVFADEGDKRSIVGVDAKLLSDPPKSRPTGERVPFGAIVEVLEEKKTLNGWHAKIKLVGDNKPLGWIETKGNLGHVKEFDPSMKPSDAVALVDSFDALDRIMACMYNTRGRYLKERAKELGAVPADLAAVLRVESSGRAFDDDGYPIMRFENHVFYRNWGEKHKDVFDKHFTFDQKTRHKNHTFRKNPEAVRSAFHLDNRREREVLAFARNLDDTAALLSASYGAAQVMGFNHKKIGYKDVQSMYAAFNAGIRPQLDGMIAYIKATPLCMEGLKNRDYFKFATGYNGKGKENDYARKIKAAAESYAKVTKGKTEAE